MKLTNILAIAVIIAAFMALGHSLGLKKEQSATLGGLSQKSEMPLDMRHAIAARDNMPLVIIGSGPAALNAALYGARARVDTLVISGKKPGGALTETSYIENWPGRAKVLGPQLMQEMTEQARSFGVSFLTDTVVSVDFAQWPYTVQTQGKKTIKACAVIIATGSSPKTLGIVGEQEYWGKGVTTCAVCDAPFHKGNDVVVIGGGDSAVEEAIQLSAYAHDIAILVRRDRMRAAESMQERLRDYPNIHVVYNAVPQVIKGDGQQVTSIQWQDTVSHELREKAVKGVFLAIGHIPNTDLFKKYLTLDSQGYIAIEGRSQKTSQPGVFAAGDVEDDHYRQAGIAAGDGIKAALDAIAFLQENGFTQQVATLMAANRFKVLETNKRAPLQPLQSIVTSKDFDTCVTENNGLVILDFYADYCPSCMRMLPSVQEVASQYEHKATFYKVDLEQSKDLAEKLMVKSIPTILVYDKGHLVGRFNQAMDKEEISNFVTKFI